MKINCETPNGGAVTLSEEHGVTVSYSVVAVGKGSAMPLLYLWMTMPDKRRLQLFVNRDTGLIVADVSEGENIGNEFIRRALPPPLTAAIKRKLHAMSKETA